MNKKHDIFSIGDAPKERVPQRQYRVEWVENSYTPGQGSDEYVSSNFDMKKLQWLFLGVAMLFVIIVFRVGYLQIARGSEYRVAAEENRIRIHQVKAPRGLVYDRHGTVLAQNIPNFVLSFTPADLPADPQQRRETIEEVAAILGESVESLLTIIDEEDQYSFQSYLLYDHVEYEKALLLEIATADLPGITLTASTFREYVAGTGFSHLLGYMSKISEEELAERPDYLFDDSIGKAGVELYYENDLRGTNGKKEVEVDSLGKENTIITEQSPQPGKNMFLTIDSNLQNTLHQAIEDTIAKNKSITGAAAIALDPNNGEVLAIVSNPTFDNNAFNLGLSSDEYQELISNPTRPLFDRTVSGEYPSGSTIKPLIAISALAEGIVTPQTSFLSSGGIQIDRWYFPDWKAGGHGQTNLAKAIAESVNTYFYLIGGGDEDREGLGVARIKTYLELFGLNALLGIDIPGEANGFLPTKEWKEEAKGERWYIGDTYHLSIGQGDILVTPLQVASYTATIANGGTVYQPHVLKAFSDPDGTITEEFSTKILNNNFICSAHFSAVQTGLREAVLSGSARSLGDLPVTAAGKTGTAQFGNQGKTHSWFTAYAPFENPEITITVLVESGGEGNDTALPIAKKGLQSWFSNPE